MADKTIEKIGLKDDDVVVEERVSDQLAVDGGSTRGVMPTEKLHERVLALIVRIREGLEWRIKFDMPRDTYEMCMECLCDWEAKVQQLIIVDDDNIRKRLVLALFLISWRRSLERLEREIDGFRHYPTDLRPMLGREFYRESDLRDKLKKGGIAEEEEMSDPGWIYRVLKGALNDGNNGRQMREALIRKFLDGSNGDGQWITDFLERVERKDTGPPAETEFASFDRIIPVICEAYVELSGATSHRE